MRQFKESKKVSAARARGDEPPFLIHPLTEKHSESEVISFLAGRPVEAVVMSSLIRDNGLESPFNRGTFYACRDAAGRLEGVALIGHATFVDARTDAALKAFALLAQEQRDAHMILGEQVQVSRFWDFYAPAGQIPRVFCRDLMFEQRWPVDAREPVLGLRRATLDDLMLIMPIHAAMAYEESGVNPMDVDFHGFRMRCARRVENGRVWIMVENGELIFKTDIASETPECIYIEGVYVDRASRQMGHGLRCLSQLGRLLLGRSDSVCALVNERNLAAQALFLKAGYKLRGYYDTIFLEREGAENSGEG
jgi:uncharacterized protein